MNLSEIEENFHEENEKVNFIDKEGFKLSYIKGFNSSLIFLFVNDIYDDLDLIKKGIIEFKERFTLQFENFQLDQLNSEICQEFDLEVNKFQMMMPPKVAIIGYQGVGKTTFTELIRSKEIPIKKIKSITGDIATLKFAKYHISLWDYTGPEDLIFLWKNFVKESNLIFLITDSTLDNVEKSKFLLNLAKQESPNASIAVFNNKFNTKIALDQERIDNILGMNTISISVLDPKFKYDIIKIILNLLGINHDTKEVLNKYIRRERVIQSFEEVLQKDNPQVAMFLFEQIIKLSEELGEDPTKMEFYKNKEIFEGKFKKELPPGEFVSQYAPPEPQKEKLENLPIVERNLKKLLRNYMDNVEGVIAAVICDREGFIITSESKREEEDDLVLGGIAVAVDSFIDRIKRQFENVTTFFNVTVIGDKKFSYCSAGKDSILTTISNLTTSESELKVYSEHIANKIELLLEGNENVSLEIPHIVKVLSKTRDGTIPAGKYTTKLILTGDYSVGKTSLIIRFVKNLFKETYQSTVGVEISQKDLEIEKDVSIRFVIWDIGGQITQMAPYRKRFFEGATTAFIVIDRTRIESLKNVDLWYNEIIKFVGKDINIILVGNKSDLLNQVVITEEEIKHVSDKYNFNYILSSAKTGENVNEAFTYIAYDFLNSFIS